MAEATTPTPPFVLSNPKVAHVKKEGEDWVPAPDEPPRLQGTVGDTYPGVPAGQTAPYTSSPVAFLAGLIFRTESDKLVTVVWEDLPSDVRRTFVPLLQRLLMKQKPAPVVEEVLATTEEAGDADVQIGGDPLAGKEFDPAAITPADGHPRSELEQEGGGPIGEGDVPPEQT